MPFTASSIIDNRDDNTLLTGLRTMSDGGQEICIATAFFSLDALLLLAETLSDYERVRILFGDDADAKQRAKLLQMLRDKSDDDLLVQRETLPQLSPLKKIEALFQQGRVEARCYTAKKFHAKAYPITRPMFPAQVGALGSGNFTRPGLLQNIELNVHLTPEQTGQLSEWFEARWDEASADVVTNDILDEIRRQIDLYEPHVLYLKALFTWGQQQQDDAPAVGARAAIWDHLDPHQIQGVRQALKILERQHGVMICDGVGLGKSFIALALMEKFCRDNENVLLLAPKNILTSSWEGYLGRYLARYRSPFGSIHEMPMTGLGFDPDEDSDSPPVREKTEELRRLAERADVIVIDESHNFRTTSAARYKNLFQIIAPARGRRKKIVLLTATPINTAYRDMSAQLSLITHNDGSIGGYAVDQIRRFAAELDKENLPVGGGTFGQLSLDVGETPSDALNRVLESVIIQRSRKTCKALSAAVGKELRFPLRQDPDCVEYEISEESKGYRDLIALADRRFRPGVNLLRQLRDALKRAEEKGTPIDAEKLLKKAERGIKLAGFLTEQYRRSSDGGRKQVRDEIHLAGLVFSNTLKQLESSPPAFQGIVQSLGVGLIARLRHVLGERAEPLIAAHVDWVRTPLFVKPSVETSDAEVADEADLADDGDTLDAGGGEPDAWLAQAIKARNLAKKLRGFDDAAFEVERWKDDILADLGFLREIHDATLAARKQPDPKLKHVAPRIEAEVAQGRRVLVFTQSQRTAEYLEHELKTRLGANVGVARIDSRVETTRAAILHAFCPNYNPYVVAPSIPARVDVLISTDVLSEGVNLQEAGAILNYDIHWNPVRLIQRIGRVDRRLDPIKTPNDHVFAILNVLPPPEIETIINLVGAVENRTLKISRALGLDVSFFKSDDPAGNLREFNSQYEGKITPLDQALTRYVRLTTVEPPDAKTQRLLDAIPPGAFGVWKGAPQNGLFALFTLEPTKKATEGDRERFAALLGRPVFALERPGLGPLFDAGEILSLLAGTVPDAPSGTPSDEAELAARLKKLKNAARGRFADISLPATIVPKLVCWMELKKETT